MILVYEFCIVGKKVEFLFLGVVGIFNEIRYDIFMCFFIDYYS